MCIDVAYYKPDVMQLVEVTLSVCSQVLSNAAWWHVYANARRVQEVLTDEQRMHQLDLAAFFRHMCQRCHMTCTIFQDEASAFRVLASLRLETPVMDRVKIGLLQLLPQVDQEAFAERYVYVSCCMTKLLPFQTPTVSKTCSDTVLPVHPCEHFNKTRQMFNHRLVLLMHTRLCL